MSYVEIHQLYSQGFSKSKIARKLGISRNRVIDYLKMSPDDFEEFITSLKMRGKKLDPYQIHIMEWLKEHPDLTSAQIYDWLEEKLKVKDVSENTVRNYVNELRDKYYIPKVKAHRTYSAIPEVPRGLQAQVDFGQTIVEDAERKKHRLYFIAFILSHSRYKYVEWLDRPFRTTDVIHTHEKAFQYFGGMPQEMVYDQDALLAINENAGDLIMTAEFTKYYQARQFRIYLCRKSDPESKGKVEQVVKFVKNNFSNHRTYNNIEDWNASCLAWLKRTGNYKIHHNIKKRPVEVHALEKPHLRQVSNTYYLFDNVHSPSITRSIQKDNIIRYGGNRYSVPKGTYRYGAANTAYVMEKEGFLYIRLKEAGKVIAKHEITDKKGETITAPEHRNKNTSKRDLLIYEIEDFFTDKTSIKWFMGVLKERYPRHLVDQLKVIQSSIKNYPNEVEEALVKIKQMNMTSANDFRDVVKSLAIEKERLVLTSPQDVQTNEKYQAIVAPERSADIYLEVLSGGK
ncbi:IS21 family transposase (plasmid) [Pseudalkalibacillus hwajinpoensis]|uniref:IS21 family transposase n=1 Tax=Guptibacillus hwajinpoensis TaxID=208199 RepID=UPI00325C3151